MVKNYTFKNKVKGIAVDVIIDEDGIIKNADTRRAQHVNINSGRLYIQVDGSTLSLIKDNLTAEDIAAIETAAGKDSAQVVDGVTKAVRRARTAKQEPAPIVTEERKKYDRIIYLRSDNSNIDYIKLKNAIDEAQRAFDDFCAEKTAANEITDAELDELKKSADAADFIASVDAWAATLSTSKQMKLATLRAAGLTITAGNLDAIKMMI